MENRNKNQNTVLKSVLFKETIKAKITVLLYKKPSERTSTKAWFPFGVFLLADKKNKKLAGRKKKLNNVQLSFKVCERKNCLTNQSERVLFHLLAKN